MRAKHIIGDFEGIFEGPRLFDPLNCPERSEGQFWAQKNRKWKLKRHFQCANNNIAVGQLESNKSSCKML
jgi:hypothetical protein